MSEKTPVLLLGLFYSSLHIAVSLGRRRIEIFGIDRNEDPIGSYSRYVKRIETDLEGDEFKSLLIDFSERLGRRIVLMPLSDYYLLFLRDYRRDLADHFLFSAPEQEILSSLLSKTRSSELLARHGIPHPGTLVVGKDSSSPPDPKEIAYPCILKPMYQHIWQTDRTAREYVGEGNRILYVEDERSLSEALEVLAPITDLIIQEFVPGPSENSYYYVGYRDSRGSIVTSYLGKKIRTLPEGLGSETLLRSVHDAALLDYGDEILDRLDYRGPAGIDFKYDERDGRYKVIEINCRVGINDCYMMKYGIDLPFVYYLDSQGIDVGPTREYPRGVTWYDPFRDLDWMRLYGKERNIGWGSWLRELFGYDVYAMLEWPDLRPFMVSILSLLARGFGKLNPFKAKPPRHSV